MDEDERWEEAHPESYLQMDVLLQDIGYARDNGDFWRFRRRMSWKKTQDTIALEVRRYPHSDTGRDIYKVIASTDIDEQKVYVQVDGMTPMTFFRRGIAYYECIVLNAIESMVRDTGRSDVSEGVNDECINCRRTD